MKGGLKFKPLQYNIQIIHILLSIVCNTVNQSDGPTRIGNILFQVEHAVRHSLTLFCNFCFLYSLVFIILKSATRMILSAYNDISRNHSYPPHLLGHKLQWLTNGSYPETDESSLQFPPPYFFMSNFNIILLSTLNHPSCLSPSGFTTNQTLYTFLVSATQATCPAHLILLGLIPRIILTLTLVYDKHVQMVTRHRSLLRFRVMSTF